jgi:hypothetical protein
MPPWVEVRGDKREPHGGDGAYGLPLMKFTLLYDGELKSNGRPRDKWKVRNQVSPQLEELWGTHPVLIQILRQRLIEPNRIIVTEVHHSVADNFPPPAPRRVGYIDLCEDINVGGKKFRPLIRNSFALRCGLKITFLRKEEPGHLRNVEGDLDNRLKTALDGLAIPNIDQIGESDQSGKVTFCLLENDSLISGLSVETGRLLTRPASSKLEVRLIIEVDVRVAEARVYNALFLGD